MKTLLSYAFVMIVCSTVFSQNYTASPFITLPGDNYDFSITSPNDYIGESEAYITWVNKNDNMYTVYLKKISPDIGDDQVIAQDTLQKFNPHFNYSKLFWEQSRNNKWQIWFTNFDNQTPGINAVFADSLSNEPQLDLDYYRLAWINNGNLLVTDFMSSSKSVIIDSINCSAPDIDQWSSWDWALVVYEKGIPDAKYMYLAELNNQSATWQTEMISISENCLNPRFGPLDDIVYQIFENPTWSIVYENIGKNNHPDTIRIAGNNLKNPVLFTFAIPTSNDIHINHSYYVIFEKDPIAGEASDIYINVFYYDYEDSLVRISDLPGKNYQPEVSFLHESDSTKVAIFWINDYNGKKDIWIAKSSFDIISSLEKPHAHVKSFSLRQNYPNPFNPSTTIKYRLQSKSHVQLTVYDITGRKVKELVNKSQGIGEYSITFDASILASGVYIYKLQAGGFEQSRKMLLLR